MTFATNQELALTRAKCLHDRCVSCICCCLNVLLAHFVGLLHLFHGLSTFIVEWCILPVQIIKLGLDQSTLPCTKLFNFTLFVLDLCLTLMQAFNNLLLLVFDYI